MRHVSSKMADRLERHVQTIAENANPATYLRVMRHEIPLADNQYLERTRIRTTENITDSDVAVCHPKFGKEDEDIWVCYIADGNLKIRYAKNTESLSKADWVLYSFTDRATACSIAFDSVARHNARGIWEFVTEKQPWVFWVTADGALRAKKCAPLGIYEHELANANVTDVSAVRGPSGEYGNWNLGLTVFFLMGGNLYYRQYIDGEWYDAEQISHNDIPADISKIKAFNTWDHRIGVQLLTSDGKLYELFSYSEGMGTRGAEYVEFKDISADVTLTAIGYRDARLPDEHIEFSGIDASVVVNYAYSAVPVSVKNVRDPDDSWGTTIEVEFDYPQTAQMLLPILFALVDSNGYHYVCQGCSVDGTTLTLIFENFSLAGNADNMTLTYTKPGAGGLLSPAVQTDSFEETFEPRHLDPSQTYPPEFYAASNTDDMKITVTLTEDLTNDDIGDISGCFSLTMKEYTMVPGGVLETTSRTVASVRKVDDDKLELTINKPNFSSVIGDITVNYDGLGGLRGVGGPVHSFSEDFTPDNLTWKGHQNDAEHIKLAGISASVTLTDVTYYDVQGDGEHIEFNGISASVTLTDVHDL